MMNRVQGFNVNSLLLHRHVTCDMQCINASDGCTLRYSASVLEFMLGAGWSGANVNVDC